LRPPVAALKRPYRAPKERDDFEVVSEEIRDLERGVRYEKRAWSRLKKAIRRFLALKVDRF
jgi:hypothetical protein